MVYHSSRANWILSLVGIKVGNWSDKEVIELTLTNSEAYCLFSPTMTSPDTSKLTVKYNEVVCVGLGLSGICLGAQLRRRWNYRDMHFYDRNESHSGTWFVNHYPGTYFSASAPTSHLIYIIIILGAAWFVALPCIHRG